MRSVAAEATHDRGVGAPAPCPRAARTSAGSSCPGSAGSCDRGSSCTGRPRTARPPAGRAAPARCRRRSARRGRRRHRLEVDLAGVDPPGELDQVRRPGSRRAPRRDRTTPARPPSRPAVGKAFVSGPSPPIAGSPSEETSAFTMRTVAPQAQFVVQIVFTTSSNTVGERSMRPRPGRRPCEVGVLGDRLVEPREIVVEPQHVGGARERRGPHARSGRWPQHLDASRSPPVPGPIRMRRGRAPRTRSVTESVRRRVVERRRRQLGEPVGVQRARQVDRLPARTSQGQRQRGRSRGAR